MQKELLLKKIAEKKTTIPRIAKEMGINKSTLYRKLENNYFLIQDLLYLRDILNLTTEDIEDIFF